jgi:hypothetical protein
VIILVNRSDSACFESEFSLRKVPSFSVFSLASLLFFAGCSISPDIRRHVEAAGQVEALMQRYFDAFNAADIEAVKDCWHAPGWISNGEANRSLETLDEVGELYAALFERIKAEGWGHSELIDEEIDVVNDTLARVKIHFRRVNQDGEVMLPEVRAGMYKVLLFDGEWKITTQAVTSPK